MQTVKCYLFNLLIATDQWLNALFGGNPNHCVSTRLYMNWPESWMRRFVDKCFFWTPNHCEQSFHNEDNDIAVWR